MTQIPESPKKNKNNSKQNNFLPQNLQDFPIEDSELQSSQAKMSFSELEDLETSSSSLWERMHKTWEDFNFRKKLVVLLAGGAVLPTIIVTAVMVSITDKQFNHDLKERLNIQLIFLNEEIEKEEHAVADAAESLAKLVTAKGLEPTQGNALAAKKTLEELIQKTQTENPNNSFYLIANAQGKTVAQYMQIIDGEDFTTFPALPNNTEPEEQDTKTEPEEQDTKQKYRPIPNERVGIDLTKVPIAEKARSDRQSLAGIELLPGEFWKILGLSEQVAIGLRKQPTENLPESKQPFEPGTYNIDDGSVGLAFMAVEPILVNNDLVGTAIVGSIINRNYQIVDRLKETSGVSTVTIFAYDWRVSTNVPYTDGETRAIGTRVSREVAETVLNRQEKFIGDANIIGIPYVTAYSPIKDHKGKSVGIAYVGESKTTVNKNLRNLNLTGYGLGAVIIIITLGLSSRIANNISNPLRRLAQFTKDVQSGEEGLRLEETDRLDEIGILSREIHQMLASVEANEELLRQEAERASFLNQITMTISRCWNREEVFQIALTESKKALKADRLIIYSLDEQGMGKIIAESVEESWPAALGAEINDPCFAQEYIEKYQQGRIQAVSNIYEAGLTKCHLQQLEPFSVLANLVTPIVVDEKLMGLLIAHQCSRPRLWQQQEIDLLAQVATHIGFAIERDNLLQQQIKAEEEQRQAKEILQSRALELLMQVDPVSKGDLSIRATVTSDEIGTIADSYNATIESLRKIVTQVQVAVEQVAMTTENNQQSIWELSQGASAQTEEISAALDRILAMAESVRAVATNAEEAELAVQQANQTVEVGDAAMNRTVEGIMAIRETVAETAKKVKRLGESSQKISKVVNLISNFADQTNLLALNASIEAAHAGEEGRGFAVVADEVRSLARQSAEATAEIETLVAEIQTETNEVVAAMEAGTQQVVSGTKLVEEARKSLTQIQTASTQIDKLVGSIAQAASEQSQDSEMVIQTIAEVAAITDKTSTSANEVSASFQELLEVGNKLQDTVGQFKLS